MPVDWVNMSLKRYCYTVKMASLCGKKSVGSYNVGKNVPFSMYGPLKKIEKLL